MTKSNRMMLAAGILALAMAAVPARGAINISTNLELFADGYLIDTTNNATLKLHKPVAREMVLECTQPWEGDNCWAFSIFKDGNNYRMYYRGSTIATSPEFPGTISTGNVCLAESPDGINWTRPVLNQVSFNGSTSNNIVLRGPYREASSNFAVFKDENPNCPPNALYKAIARHYIENPDGSFNSVHLNSYISSNGIDWVLYDDELPYKGALDAYNFAIWDPVEGKYWIYYRDRVGGPRSTAVGWSHDFITWHDGGYVINADGTDFTQVYPVNTNTLGTVTATTTDNKYIEDSTASWTVDQFKNSNTVAPDLYVVQNLITGQEHAISSNTKTRIYANWIPATAGDRYRIIKKVEVVKELKYNYDPFPKAQMYTSPTVKYFRAPHLFVAFPNRYYPDPDNRGPTEALFMMGRDGSDFYRYLDSPIITTNDPANRDGNRGTYTALGLLQLPGDVANHEMSMYAQERYNSSAPYPDYANLGVRLRRFTYRLDGFASVNAGTTEGQMLTKALVLSSTNIVINGVATNGGSYIKVEVCNTNGIALPGFEAAQCVPFTGDSIAHTVAWSNSPSLASHLGSNVRLRFVMKNADLYSMRFASASAPAKPTVTINQAAGQADPTASSPINFTVVFSEAVTGFTTGDVILSGTAGATTAVVTGSGTTYNVAVSGMTGPGTVVASIGADVVTGGNQASTSTDNTVTCNSTTPTVTSNQAASQGDPTNASPINFTVVFSAVVTGFAGGDVTLSGTAGATTAVVTGSGTTYNVAVSGMTGSGTVIASIGADVVDGGNYASTSTDKTVTYNLTAPTVTINQAAGQADPTGSSPINFTVVFSEAVSGFATGDVTLGGTAGATTATVTEIAPNDGTSYNVAVSGMTGDGTVIASLAAGVAQDLAGNPSAASTSTDNEVTYNTTDLNPYAWNGSSSGAWTTGANWDTGTSPNTNTGDAVFYQTGAGNLITYLGTSGRTIRSLTFNANADSDVYIGLDAGDGSTARTLSLSSDTGTSTIRVEAGATGNFTLKTLGSIAGGRIQLNNNLVIDHNGSGLLDIQRLRDDSGTLTVTKKGAGTMRTFPHGSQDFHGEYIIEGGTLLFGAADTIEGENVTVKGGTLDLSTYSQTTALNTVTLQSGAIDGTGTLISSNSFAMQSGTVNVLLAGSAALSKTTTGTLTLNNANTYTGATVVNGGSLLINGSQTGATGTVTVGGGSASGTPTLGGTGTIGGNVTIKAAGSGAAGTLAPGGASVGTLSLNNTTLTLESGAKLAYRLGTASDSVAGVGTLSLNGQGWSDFTFTEEAGFGPGTYVLIEAASVSGSLGGTVSGSIGSYTGTLSVDGNSDLILTVSSGAPAPVDIDYSLVGGELILDWPAGQGWQLEAQTNTLATGLTTNWFPVTGATPPYTNALNPGNPAVYYRLINP